MERVPESERVPEWCVDDLLRWIAHELDAAWAAKLAILRVSTREDIALFGAFLREHDRHVQELAQLVRAADPRRDIPQDPPFVTREALVIGGLDDGEAVIEAMKTADRTRIERYDRRERWGAGGPARLIDALLERHRADAQARLVALGRRGSMGSARQEAAA